MSRLLARGLMSRRRPRGLTLRLPPRGLPSRQRPPGLTLRLLPRELTLPLLPRGLMLHLLPQGLTLLLLPRALMLRCRQPGGLTLQPLRPEERLCQGTHLPVQEYAGLSPKRHLNSLSRHRRDSP